MQRAEGKTRALKAEYYPCIPANAMWVAGRCLYALCRSVRRRAHCTPDLTPTPNPRLVCRLQKSQGLRRSQNVDRSPAWSAWVMGGLVDRVRVRWGTSLPVTNWARADCIFLLAMRGLAVVTTFPPQAPRIATLQLPLSAAIASPSEGSGREVLKALLAGRRDCVGRTPSSPQTPPTPPHPSLP